MVVRMRHTRSHTGNRRSHHALSVATFAVCDNCGAKTMKHTVCMSCGKYKGREVIDIVGKSARKEAKRKERAKAEAK